MKYYMFVNDDGENNEEGSSTFPLKMNLNNCHLSTARLIEYYYDRNKANQWIKI